MSVSDIARSLGYSSSKVDYWLNKFNIQKRSISEAIFAKKHDVDDGFMISRKLSPSDRILFGLGLGIYWGEGNKKNKHTVRVGNTDPRLLAVFIDFLVKICGVDRSKIKFSLQIFSDIDPKIALSYWVNTLKSNKNQVMPTINCIKSGKIGTYKMKNHYGVLTVYVFNMKHRNWLVDQLSVPR